MNDKKLKHIAAIMDGNARYAIKSNLSQLEGYRAGLKTAQKLVNFCKKMMIPFVTLYVFSYENWQREREEVDLLMNLLEDYLKENIAKPFTSDIKVCFIGDRELIPKHIQELMLELEEGSKGNSFTVNLAISYGGRNEIVRAATSFAQDLSVGKVKAENMDEGLFSKYLDTANIPEPDIMIRTGKNIRLSNFLLWQLAYTELFFLKKLWPELEEDDFYKVIDEYNNRVRTFGK